MKVVKRNGKYENYNCKKIKKAIAFACEGLDVNPLELEAKFDEILYDGVSTKAIQDNLILHSKNLASPISSDWLLVSGRLATMNRWNETRSYDKQFLELYKQFRADGTWSHKKFKVYSDEEIEIIGGFIVKERDLQHTIASVETAESKYLNQGECIQHIFIGNAMLYASVEKQTERMYYVEKYYEELSNLRFSLASPQLMNMRKGLNNASCFIIAPSDNLDSIYNNFKNTAMISKSGGGLGFYAGYIRAKGSKLMGESGASGGVIPMIKVFNDTLVYVNQAGKRKGAGTVALPIWHNDILDFLDIQTEVGDPRNKSFDIQPQICFNDLFMNMLKEDKSQTWFTFCPYEIKDVLGIVMPEQYNEDFVMAYRLAVQAYKDGKLKVVTEHIINDLWKHYLMVFFERGRPYATFIDKINRDNPNKHDGVILCGNLCVAPETTVLTRDGYKVISEIVDTDVDVWNGEEWSSVRVVKTGTDREVVKVHLSEFINGTKTNDVTLVCTPEHKWYDKNGNMLRTYELQTGLELLSWNNPNGDKVSHAYQYQEEHENVDTFCFREPKRHMGVFNGILTGQCQESFSNTKPDEYAHTCSLASLVVGRIPLNELSEKAALLTRLLNAGMEITKTPIQESDNHVQAYRTIGVGIQGMADILAREWRTYDNLEFITEVAERIQYGCVSESINMAKEYSEYPKFKSSRWDIGDIFDEYHANSVCKDLDWLRLKAECKRWGIYNSQMTSPAPNTSTSLFMMASAGFMPHYADYFYEDNKNGKTPVAAMYLKDNPIFYANSVGYFKQHSLTKAVGVAQKFVDTGISAEYVLDRNMHNATAKDIDLLVKSAWENENKTVYYLRTVKQGESLVKTSDICASCSG